MDSKRSTDEFRRFRENLGFVIEKNDWFKNNFIEPWDYAETLPKDKRDAIRNALYDNNRREMHTILGEMRELVAGMRGSLKKIAGDLS